MDRSARVLSMIQAEVIGESFGKALVELLLTVGAILLSIGGFILFLWLVRKLDKRIHK